MAQRSLSPRVAPLEQSELSPEQDELLATLGENRDLHIFRTLVRHPRLFRRWSPFGGHLLRRGRLAGRDRELVILRTAFRCGCAYEWAQHVAIAREAGLSEEEIRRVTEGPTAPGWAPEDATLLSAADELRDAYRIADETWDRLAGRFGEQELIELTMLAGHYALLAGTLNSLGVQPEGPLPALGEA
ncbi:MAG: carboxymuconolactone decarboxylase family protein [Candidatus Dormibacteraeota bacterium]|nr:carboxymuconolactone decarboxylase family protein [Candidatus Dormibacteraeota bacterium]